MDILPLGSSLARRRATVIAAITLFLVAAGTLTLPVSAQEESAFTHTHRLGFKLQNSFSEHFTGTPEEAATAFRKEFEEAAGKLPPTIKFEVRPDKRRLFVEFDAETGEALRNNKLAGFLKESGWWIPPQDPNEARRKAWQAVMGHRERAKEWVEAIVQLDDEARRKKALDEMKAAMASDDTDQQTAALIAFTQASSTEFDKAQYRPLVESLLKSPDASVRAAALSALQMIPRQEGDLERALALMDDPSSQVRESLAFALFHLSNRDLTGRAGEAILKLLDTPDTKERLAIVRALWGAKFSPALEHRLAELAYAGDRDLAYYSVYSALSTQQNKGKETIDVLLERLGHPDTVNVGHRAMWGLGYGVEPDQQGRVADAALKAVQLRADLRNEALRSLGAYGRPEQVEALEEVAKKDGVSAELKKQIQQTITAIRDRAGEKQ